MIGCCAAAADPRATALGGPVHRRSDRRLENRYAPVGDDDDCNPFGTDDEPLSHSQFDDGWQEDAFMPRPVESLRFHSYPPVYGGFPLLDDGEPDDANTF